MSTHISIAMGPPPTGARLSSRSLDQLSEDWIAERCERAREEGRQEALDELSGSTGKALVEAARRLDVAREQAEREVGPFAVELAVGIANLLLRREVDSGHYDIEGIVREALAASGVGRAPCVVHLNPTDVERLEGVPFRKGTEIEADTSLAAGDVHISTPQGLLVRELDGCLAAVREKLLGGLD